MFYLILGVIVIVGGAVLFAAWLAFVVVAVVAGVIYGLYQAVRDWRTQRVSKPDTTTQDQTRMQAMIMAAARRGTTPWHCPTHAVIRDGGRA